MLFKNIFDGWKPTLLEPESEPEPVKNRAAPQHCTSMCSISVYCVILWNKSPSPSAGMHWGSGHPAEAVLGSGHQQPVPAPSAAPLQAARQPCHPGGAARTRWPAGDITAHAPVEQSAGLPRQGHRHQHAHAEGGGGHQDPGESLPLPDDLSHTRQGEPFVTVKYILYINVVFPSKLRIRPFF